MKFTSAFIVSLALALGGTAATAAPGVLFIGNSYLFGYGSAVRYYRANTVTDLNDESIGGVPALFKSFTQQAAFDQLAVTNVVTAAPKETAARAQAKRCVAAQR